MGSLKIKKKTQGERYNMLCKRERETNEMGEIELMN